MDARLCRLGGVLALCTAANPVRSLPALGPACSISLAGGGISVCSVFVSDAARPAVGWWTATMMRSSGCHELGHSCRRHGAPAIRGCSYVELGESGRRVAAGGPSHRDEVSCSSLGHGVEHFQLAPDESLVAVVDYTGDGLSLVSLEPPHQCDGSRGLPPRTTSSSRPMAAALYQQSRQRPGERRRSGGAACPGASHAVRGGDQVSP